jgi:hypothetical protein
MWKRASAWMVLTPTLALTSCLSVNESAICDGTLRLRDAHTTALLEDAGQRAVKTGAALIASIDVACGDV